MHARTQPIVVATDDYIQQVEEVFKRLEDTISPGLLGGASAQPVPELALIRCAVIRGEFGGLQTNVAET